MSRKDELKSLLGMSQPSDPAVNSTPRPGTRLSDDPNVRGRTVSGVVRAMGGSLGNLRAEIEEVQALKDFKEAHDRGDLISELDPLLVDPSFIHDRLPGGEDLDFEAFKEGIRVHGQKVPILVRPHPSAEGRYEIAYGRRRITACAQLSRKVRAIIAPLTDTELVIAQGKENQDRIDPSFIERARFAKALEERGFERSVIMDAVSVDKTELSRLLAVANAVPFEIVSVIGPARKAGRPRWTALAERVSQAKNAKSIMETLTASSEFIQSPSDQRFAMVFEALVAKPPRSGVEKVWKNRDKQTVVRIAKATGATKLSINEKVAPQFAAFLLERLPALYQEYEARKAEKEQN